METWIPLLFSLKISSRKGRKMSLLLLWEKRVSLYFCLERESFEYRVREREGGESAVCCSVAVETQKCELKPLFYRIR